MDKEEYMNLYFKEILSPLYQEYIESVGLNIPEDDKIKKLFHILYFTDNYTKIHSENVAYYASMLSSALGFPEDEVDRINKGALLHDIGKIFIPNPILTKSTFLTDLEFEIIKRHPVTGADLLLNNNLAVYEDIVRYHHERFDGRGYPDGLKGDEIPIAARITSVSDTFDAMVNHRPYGRLLTVSQAFDELRRSSGTQLDKELVDQFISLMTYATPNQGLLLRRKKR